ncbi:MAG: Fic family protein [Candidatus Levybacteria bacterium]|nr:Fic family protein [Candidatus Levybacteria bacterium]
MQIPPSYKINPEILDLISKIEANRIYFSSKEIPFQIKEKIQRVSILKSSLYSARIEGNPLTLEEIDIAPSEEQKKIEIFNILKAVLFIDKNIKAGKISEKEILKLHAIVMADLFSQKGIFRQEMGAIFNSAGIAVYLSPPPKQIPLLLAKLLTYINSESEKFPLVSALIAHLIFEKIHPFIDGNGRVGRLLIFAILKAKNWHFEVNIPFEEYLDQNKSGYYYYLDIGLKEPEEYLIFMLNAFLMQTEKTKKLLEDESDKKETIFLPPRQEELLNIIKDHPVISFDGVKRRFLKIPERTLRYDLKKLLDLNLIEKSGVTKGNYYRAK